MSQDAAVARDHDQVVHRLFEEHVRRTPDSPAVRCGTEQLSYAELDQRANRLARHLRVGLGVPSGALVAVSMGRTVDVIVAMLAVLKAGAAYVPVEPSAPESLIRNVAAAAKPVAVLTHESHRVRLSDAFEAPVVCLDTDAAQIGQRAADPVDSEAGPGDLACVFFTSGSTGLPKGALVEHGNLVAAFRGWQEVLCYTASDRHLQSTTFEFDVFTADWVRALCSGGTLVMALRNFTLDRTAEVAELYALILAERITVVGTNVLMARRLGAYLLENDVRLEPVRLLMAGGDKWHLDELTRLQEHLGDSTRVLDIYGVAEAGIDCGYFEVSMLRDSPEDRPRQVSLIGLPFPGTRFDVLRADGRSQCPAEEAGEIWICGPTVGRGYLDGAETGTRFRSVRTDTQADGRSDTRIDQRTDPRTDARELPGYRTGDVAIRRRDGLFAYVGRLGRAGAPADALAAARTEGLIRDRHPEVGECVVTEIDAPDGTRVPVAYVVPADPARPVDVDEIRTVTAFARDPIAPAAVIALPSLPRTRAGKIDRSSLPLPAVRDDTRSLSSVKGLRAFGSVKAAGAVGSAPASTRLLAVFLTAAFAVLAGLLTNTFWPSSTDLSLVPEQWHALFSLLYAFEDIAFGFGVAFLFTGLRLLRRLGRPPGLTRAAHLSITWLLAAWWPQDNTYRVTSPTDWAAQIGLVYGFNITLMIAAALVVWFVAAQRRDQRPRHGR